MITNDNIKEKLNSKFQEQILSWTENHSVLSAEILPEYNLKIVKFLFDEGFQFLTDLTAIHFPNQKDKELRVTYLLYNMKENFHIRLNLSVPVSKPDVFTLTKIFATSNWLERECYDFYGVNFVGHPNLIRVMNVDEMDYHPLRKEFPLEDQRRTDKDDDMFGRGAYFVHQN